MTRTTTTTTMMMMMMMITIIMMMNEGYGMREQQSKIKTLLLQRFASHKFYVIISKKAGEFLLAHPDFGA